MVSERDVVAQARDVLTRLPDKPYHLIEHDTIFNFYLAAPDLLRALADEVERLRKQLVQTAQDARHDAQSAADEAYWRDKQGDEYGSY